MTVGNMGPFDPVSLKGGADINGVPVFTKELPLRIGGIAGEDIKFGRVVSINPQDRRKFYLGVKSGYIVKGISMLDPTIMRVAPGMNDYYYAGRPMTVTTLGIIEINEYDTTQGAPAEGSTVWCKNATGELAFNDGTDIKSSGYTKLNAFVYESLDPNGAKVFFNIPLVTAQTRETIGKVATPTATPARGAVASGTEVKIACATSGAKIFYTIDGTTPNMSSSVYTGPIAVTGAVTIKAIAVKEGMDASSAMSEAYTIA